MCDFTIILILKGIMMLESHFLSSKIINFKGNVQALFLCNSQKLDASQVWITFRQVTQKILTKDIFHWLELTTEIPSFLQIFSVRKTTTQKICEKINKKIYISTILWAFKNKLQIIHATPYIALLFICLVLYFHICLSYFLILCF